MWSKILKFIMKYGPKAVAWAKKNKWILINLAWDVIVSLIEAIFG